MSTILKALQRLEVEKGAGSERSLDERVVASRPAESPGVRSYRWLGIGAAVIAGIGVGSLALYLWSPRGVVPPEDQQLFVPVREFQRMDPARPQSCFLHQFPVACVHRDEGWPHVMGIVVDQRETSGALSARERAF